MRYRSYRRAGLLTFSLFLLFCIGSTVAFAAHGALFSALGASVVTLLAFVVLVFIIRLPEPPSKKENLYDTTH